MRNITLLKWAEGSIGCGCILQKFNLKYDKGIYSGAVVDYYDFSWLKHSPNLKQAIFNAVNNNAVIQQCNGGLTPYIIIIPFIIYEN